MTYTFSAPAEESWIISEANKPVEVIKPPALRGQISPFS